MTTEGRGRDAAPFASSLGRTPAARAPRSLGPPERERPVPPEGRVRLGRSSRPRVLFWASNFDRDWIREHVWFIARGLVFTLAMAAFGIVLAIVLALVGALGRLSRNPIAYGISGFYTSFFRGTPLIVQLFLFYLAMPRTALNLFDRFENFLPQNFADFFTWTSFQVGILVSV